MVMVSELIAKLDNIRQTFPNAVVKAQGWNDQGDLMDLDLRGDVRLERDAVGNPVIMVR